MSQVSNATSLSAALGEVWPRPRQKVDTASILESCPSQFTAAVLLTILTLCAGFLSFLSTQPGPPPEARIVTLPAGIVAGIAFVAAILAIRSLVLTKSLFADEKVFARAVLQRILLQPSAPNMHLWERVGVATSFGDETAEDVHEALHDWMAVTTAKITAPLLQAAGLQPEQSLADAVEILASDVVPKRLLGRVQGTPNITTETVTGPDGPTQVWTATAEAMYRYQSKEGVDTLNEAGQRLVLAGVRCPLTVTVAATPAGNWFLLSAAVGEPKAE